MLMHAYSTTFLRHILYAILMLKTKKVNLIQVDTLLAVFGSLLSMTQKLTNLHQPASTCINMNHL